MIAPFPRLFTALLLLLASPAPAGSAPAEWSVRGWQLQLPEKTVLAIETMPDGYLWIPTPARVVRFDGVEFDHYPLEEFFGQDISPSKIRKAARSSTGGLWLALDRGGLVRCEMGGFQFVTNGVPKSSPHALAADNAGGAWLACNNGSVCHVADGRPVMARCGEGVPEKELCDLAADGRGTIWFYKGDKVGVVNGDRLEPKFSLTAADHCLAGARAGGAWICAGFHLFKCDADGRRTDCGEPALEFRTSRPIAMLEDRDGRVWIGTVFGGLFVYDGGEFQNVPTSHSKIVSLAQDREGNVWAGTAEGGVLRVQPGVVQLEGSDIASPLQTFRSLCEDARGTLWAVNGNGALLVRQNDSWKPSPVSPPGRLTCVAAANDGGVWIGGYYRKVFHLRDGKIKSWGREQGLDALRVRLLLADRDDGVWVATEGHDSLKHLAGDAMETIHLPADVRDISAMTMDAAGDLWIGDTHGDLMRVNGRGGSDEGRRASTPAAWIRSLRAAADGRIWICYRDIGVGSLKDGRFTLITPAQGLYHAAVNELLFDGGWAWFSSERGIFRVRETELDAVADGAAARLQSVYHGAGGKFSEPQILFGESTGALRGRDGRLWMPMLGAVAIIDPRGALDDLPPAPVVVKQVLVDDRPAAKFGGFSPARGVPELADRRTVLQFPARHRYVQFDFTALSFAAPQNIRFQYRLNGFDDHWIDAGTQRDARYSRLPAGDYRFQVKACNSSGVWNEAGAAIAFTVAPFVWQRLWFRSAALLLFTVLVVALVRYVSFRRLRVRLHRLEQQAALEKERTRIARDLHDDLGSRLTKIILLNELTLQRRAKPEMVGGHVQQSLAMARQMIKSLDETVWAVNPRNDTLPHLINYLGEFALEFAQTAGIRCRVDLPPSVPPRNLPSEVRHNLFLASKEALNNVVRHSQATEIWLRAAIADGSLRLTIADNGRGFAATLDSPTADGLRNMRQRMKDIGGEFLVESSAGTGTKVTLICPLAAQ